MHDSWKRWDYIIKFLILCLSYECMSELCGVKEQRILSRQGAPPSSGKMFHLNQQNQLFPSTSASMQFYEKSCFYSYERSFVEISDQFPLKEQKGVEEFL